MIHELKIFAIKLACTIGVAPIMGYVIMICSEQFEKYWKTNDRKKKWLVSCGIFLLLAGIAGWLR